MTQHHKQYQFFACVEKQFIQQVLEILNTEQGISLGISRDPSIRIIDSSDPNLKLIPIHLHNVETLENAIIFLKNRNTIEFKIIKLPWDEKWKRQAKNSDLHGHLDLLLDHNIVEFIPKTFDTIGNLAILEIDRWGELSEFIQNPIELSHILSVVGQTIINIHKNIKTVLRKGGNIEGEFRLREYQIIAGTSNTITTHRENNCIFHVDPTKMFFSPRLSFERNRVSNLNITKNATIIDCFAGIGPFSIQIARKHDVQIYCIEKNPTAYEFLQKNIAANKNLLKGVIHPFMGDFREFFTTSNGQMCINNADYVIMNLPERSHEFLPDIFPFVKKDATILIYYSLIRSSGTLQDTILQFKHTLRESKLDLVKILHNRVVFSHSPSQNNVGIDAIIKRI